MIVYRNASIAMNSTLPHSIIQMPASIILRSAFSYLRADTEEPQQLGIPLVCT